MSLLYESRTWIFKSLFYWSVGGKFQMLYIYIYTYNYHSIYRSFHTFIQTSRHVKFERRLSNRVNGLITYGGGGVNCNKNCWNQNTTYDKFREPNENPERRRKCSKHIKAYAILLGEYRNHHCYKLFYCYLEWYRFQRPLHSSRLQHRTLTQLNSLEFVPSRHSLYRRNKLLDFRINAPVF